MATKLSSSIFCILLFSAFTFLCSSINARKTIEYHELRRNDFSIRATNWGATILSVVLPDAKGKLDDIVLGYDTTRTIAPYINDTTYFGALVGRVANRIAGARFNLDGKTYKLFPNEGNNTLHGGNRGFSRVLWTVKEVKGGDYPAITYYYRSFDGEQGFPGDLDVYVTYKIAGDYQLHVKMEAFPRNKATAVNLAQHSYWNLAGHSAGTILPSTIQIFASHITPVDSALIPTGAITSVLGSPFDFTSARTIGSRIEAAGGYDVNYVLDSPAGADGLRRAAVVSDAKSGRTMELWTDQPGMQFYTSNMITREEGKGGVVYGKYAGLCLETQGFPNAVNEPAFPSQFVRPGEVYRHNMLYRFSFH